MMTGPLTGVYVSVPGAVVWVRPCTCAFAKNDPVMNDGFQGGVPLLVQCGCNTMPRQGRIGLRRRLSEHGAPDAAGVTPHAQYCLIDLGGGPVPGWQGVRHLLQLCNLCHDHFEKCPCWLPFSCRQCQFKAYVTSDQIRHIIDTGEFPSLATNPFFSTQDFRAVPAKYRSLIPNYVKDYVSLNQFAA